QIRRLPESFAKLPKVQVLLVTACNKLVRVPSSIRRMPTLCEFDISECPSLSWRDRRGLRGRENEEDEEGEEVAVDEEEEEGGEEAEDEEGGDVAGEGEEADGEEEGAESGGEDWGINHEYGLDSEDDGDDDGWRAGDDNDEE
ncbi:unnamed protein product, partial [Closterium sp. NIES-53]